MIKMHTEHSTNECEVTKMWTYKQMNIKVCEQKCNQWQSTPVFLNLCYVVGSFPIWTVCLVCVSQFLIWKTLSHVSLVKPVGVHGIWMIKHRTWLTKLLPIIISLVSLLRQCSNILWQSFAARRCFLYLCFSQFCCIFFKYGVTTS